MFRSARLALSPATGMNMHEEAFVNCDLAVDSRNVKVPGLFATGLPPPCSKT